MDQERFDELARGLVSGTTRRGMVRRLTGAALGGILVAVGVGAAGARKRKHGRRKHKAKAPAGQVAACHYDADAETWQLITISQSEWDTVHAKHNEDFQPAAKDGCCRNSECSGLTNQCNVGKCVVNDDRVGACKAVPTPGAICNDGDACTRRDTCDDGGTCVGGPPRPCQARACNNVTCNPGTGECDYTPTPGQTCGDGRTCNNSGECIEI